MNKQLIKGTFILMLLSLVSTFSSFAMELPPAEEKGIIPLGEYWKPKEILGIFNETKKPVFISDIVQLDPSSIYFIDITENWLANPFYISAIEFPDVFSYYLSKAKNAVPFVDIIFFINVNSGKAQVVVKFFNRNPRVLNFDIEKAAWEKGLDLLFATVVKDDITKPDGNFEETYFELLLVDPGSGNVVERVLSNEEFGMASAA
jgi:hypothetical protein